VAVEKLASKKSAKIKTRQEALQTIFFDHLDIFYPTILICFREKGVFQQPPLLSTVIRPGPSNEVAVGGKRDPNCNPLRHGARIDILSGWKLVNRR
jgi:hypothetical protein